MYPIERGQRRHDRIRCARPIGKIGDGTGRRIGELRAGHEQTGQLLIAEAQQRFAQSSHKVEVTRAGPVH